MPTSDPKLAALEKSLSALVPVPGRIDRDQLMFRAGQASVRHKRWLWPSATVFLAVLALGLGTALAMRSAPSPLERIVYVPEPRAPASDSTTVVSPSMVPRAQDGRIEDVGEAWTGSTGYLHDRNQVIRWGVDALAPSPSMAATSETPSLESMLGLPEKKADPGGLFRLKF